MVRTTISSDPLNCRVTLQGELDISNLTELKGPLERTLESITDDQGIIIDLHKVSYIDSAVLEVIVRARNDVFKSGKQLQVITRRDSQPDRVLRTCRFDTILDLHSLDSSAATPATS